MYVKEEGESIDGEEDMECGRVAWLLCWAARERGNWKAKPAIITLREWYMRRSYLRRLNRR